MHPVIPCSLLVAFVAITGALPALAENVSLSSEDSQLIEPVLRDTVRLQASIREHSATELALLLNRAEELVVSYEAYPHREPVAFVLAGDEITLFSRSNYASNRSLIDQAARLEAFGVIDLKVCESWLTSHGMTREDLPAFIDYVSSGSEEVHRLEASGYAWF